MGTRTVRGSGREQNITEMRTVGGEGGTINFGKTTIIKPSVSEGGRESYKEIELDFTSRDAALVSLRTMFQLIPHVGHPQPTISGISEQGIYALISGIKGGDKEAAEILKDYTEALEEHTSAYKALAKKSKGGEGIGDVIDAIDARDKIVKRDEKRWVAAADRIVEKGQRAEKLFKDYSKIWKTMYNTGERKQRYDFLLGSLRDHRGVTVSGKYTATQMKPRI